MVENQRWLDYMASCRPDPGLLLVASRSMSPSSPDARAERLHPRHHPAFLPGDNIVESYAGRVSRGRRLADVGADRADADQAR